MKQEALGLSGFTPTCETRGGHNDMPRPATHDQRATS